MILKTLGESSKLCTRPLTPGPSPTLGRGGPKSIECFDRQRESSLYSVILNKIGSLITAETQREIREDTDFPLAQKALRSGFSVFQDNPNSVFLSSCQGRPFKVKR